MVTMMSTTLNLEGEDFYFNGDLRLIGDTIINGGNFIVTGQLILAIFEDEDGIIVRPSLEIIGGDLVVGDLSVEDENGVYDSDYDICDHLYVEGNIHITNGNLDIASSNIDKADNIIIDTGDLVCFNILYCTSLYVNGDITAYSINCSSDLFCNGDTYINTSITCSGDLYVSGELASQHNPSLTVKGHFYCGIFADWLKVEIG